MQLEGKEELLKKIEETLHEKGYSLIVYYSFTYGWTCRIVKYRPMDDTFTIDITRFEKMVFGETRQEAIAAGYNYLVEEGLIYGVIF